MKSKEDLVQDSLNRHISTLMSVAKERLSIENISEEEKEVDLTAMTLAFYFVYKFLDELLRKEGLKINKSIKNEVSQCAKSKLESIKVSYEDIN